MPPLNPSSTEELMFMSIRSAREAALTVLEQHRVSGMWASDLLDKVFRESRLPVVERGLAHPNWFCAGVGTKTGDFGRSLKGAGGPSCGSG